VEKVAFLFPGQGSHYVGMGKKLCEDYSIAMRTFEEANEALGYDLMKICFNGSIFKLNKMENMFPALLTTSVACYRVYMHEIGFSPQVLAGHSLGEYSALTCAGVISFSDAVKIVNMRGKLAQEAINAKIGDMTICEGIEWKLVEGLCKTISGENLFTQIACYNDDDKVSVSGTKEGILKIEREILKKKGKIVPLVGGGPFHCELMTEAAMKLYEELKKYNYNEFRYPVISNVTSLPYKIDDNIAHILREHLIRPVQWVKTLERLNDMNITLFVEMSTRNMLCDIMNLQKFKQKKYKISKDDIQKLQRIPDFKEWGNNVTPISKCLSATVSTPNKNLKNYDPVKVLDMYKQIESIEKKQNKSSPKHTAEDILEAFRYLKDILNEKEISMYERKQIISDIIDTSGLNYLYDDFLKAL